MDDQRNPPLPPESFDRGLTDDRFIPIEAELAQQMIDFAAEMPAYPKQTYWTGRAQHLRDYLNGLAAGSDTIQIFPGVEMVNGRVCLTLIFTAVGGDGKTIYIEGSKVLQHLDPCPPICPTNVPTSVFPIQTD